MIYNYNPHLLSLKICPSRVASYTLPLITIRYFIIHVVIILIHIPLFHPAHWPKDLVLHLKCLILKNETKQLKSLKISLSHEILGFHRKFRILTQSTHIS